MKNRRPVVSYFRLPTGPRLAQTSQLLPGLRAEAHAFADAQGLVVIEPFLESARGAARPELQRALALCREHPADLLVPRIALVGGDLVFLESVVAARVRVHAADVGGVGRRILTILSEIAKHQQLEASQRSRDALRHARRRGVRLGSPHPERGSRAGVAALRARAAEHAEQLAPTLGELLLSNPGASLRDLAELLEARGESTPRRGRWGPSAVRNLLQRSGLDTWRRGAEE